MAKKSVRVPLWMDSSKVVVVPTTRHGNILCFTLSKALPDIQFEQITQDNNNIYAVNQNRGFTSNEKRRVKRTAERIMNMTREELRDLLDNN